MSLAQNLADRHGAPITLYVRDASGRGVGRVERDGERVVRTFAEATA